MSTKCPKCNCNDQIQKLSSIYDAGRVTGKMTGNSVHFTGKKIYNSINVSTVTMESSLASRLQPPTPPGFNKIWYLAPFFCICMLFAPIDKQSKIWIGLILVIGSSISSLIGSLTLPTLIAISIVYYKALKEAEAKIIREQMPYYIAKRKEWENSYYCHRDDVIFLA
jgi:hypothetical protein